MWGLLWASTGVIYMFTLSDRSVYGEKINTKPYHVFFTELFWSLTFVASPTVGIVYSLKHIWQG